MDVHPLIAAGSSALILLLIAGAVALFSLLIWAIIAWTGKSIADTQRYITDAELLELLDRQPDGLLSPHQLAEQTELTLSQARTRLSALATFGILASNYNNRARYFYSLHEPLSERPELSFSAEPFLTVGDLQILFQHYGGRPTAQQLIMGTRLPLAVIKREMKHFEKQGVVQRLRKMQSGGMTYSVFYALQEPYRSEAHRLDEDADRLDLEMKTLLRNESLIV